MKKTFLIITAISCINLGTFAQTASPVSSQGEQIELLGEMSNINGLEETLEVKANKITPTKAEMRQINKEQRKKGGWKDISLGKKILAGAFILVVVVLYVATGGEGVSSR